MSASQILSNEATESKAVESLKKRLGEQAVEIDRLEKLLSGAKRRRITLILKLVRAGLSERVVGSLARLSGPRVHQIVTDACNCHRDLPHVGEIGKYATAGCPIHGADSEATR